MSFPVSLNKKKKEKKNNNNNIAQDEKEEKKIEGYITMGVWVRGEAENVRLWRAIESLESHRGETWSCE